MQVVYAFCVKQQPWPFPPVAPVRGHIQLLTTANSTWASRSHLQRVQVSLQMELTWKVVTYTIASSFPSLFREKTYSEVAYYDLNYFNDLLTPKEGGPTQLCDFQPRSFDPLFLLLWCWSDLILNSLTLESHKHLLVFRNGLRGPKLKRLGRAFSFQLYKVVIVRSYELGGPNKDFC